jgi:hypothetical protein
MTAQLGADGVDLLGDPLPELLTDVAGVQPQPGGEWVHLKDKLGFRSVQRLVIKDVAGSVVVATWPAELAVQARYLYGGGRGSALVAAAIERGWTIEPSPHIAYWTASPARRCRDGSCRRGRGQISQDHATAQRAGMARVIAQAQDLRGKWIICANGTAICRHNPNLG